jgi:hypothetical protein
MSTAVVVDSSPTQKDIPVVLDPRVEYLAAPSTGSTYTVPLPKKPHR